MSKIPYVIDSSVLIEAHRRYYSFRVCPGFWDAMIFHHGTGQVCSVDRVHTELTQGADPLCDWVQGSISASFFQATGTSAVIAAFGQLSRWLNAESQYLPAAKTQFLNGADPWLIAHCLVHSCTLVTQEAPAPAARNKVPIPNVCNAFSVVTCNTFELLGNLFFPTLRPPKVRNMVQFLVQV